MFASWLRTHQGYLPKLSDQSSGPLRSSERAVRRRTSALSSTGGKISTVESDAGVGLQFEACVGPQSAPVERGVNSLNHCCTLHLKSLCEERRRAPIPVKLTHAATETVSIFAGARRAPCRLIKVTVCARHSGRKLHNSGIWTMCNG